MISHFDHIVLTVSDIRRAVDFYTRVLCMEDVTFANGRKAVAFGNQKINFQLLGEESRNVANVGAGDVCLISTWSLAKVIDHLNKENVKVIEGPVEKSGAVGAIQSVYFLDPDKNLIEVSVYQ
ncbi:VOC family protein [Vibrio parahaemolyticus]|uniref:VOC family protein n=1 Tax=Vibrio parahaemolyticus TaxID=670 RepID=UPI000470EEC9|nr:VOC family protein [Vibrio parahaemolyticus]EGQ8166961.1 VOC family protein [Vibrio parahaemolyticus]EGR0998158.1 VOC family protein [Vibrio parahaemolyticus]EGR3441848.1 VOC family virulence protein [Vibrio parahaemolyticus]EIV8665886.1 VOC family protein [Vibrio parahaemolyticus]EJG0043289.1 VOC family protein [Vibrio parahaemolyticus]